MLVDLHAIALLLLSLLTAVVCIKGWEKPTKRRILTGILGGLPLAFLFSGTLLYHELPAAQWAIPGICISLVIISSGNKRFTTPCIFVLSLSAFILSLHYNDLAHGPALTGTPGWTTKLNDIQSHRLQQLPDVIRNEIPQANEEYPAGWLCETSFYRKAQSDFLDARSDHFQKFPRYLDWVRGLDQMGGRQVISNFWHSWFTRLYRVEGIPQRLWFPGGTLKDGVAKLEWRDFPGNSPKN